jgi:SAM-dependent methyltransferase
MPHCHICNKEVQRWVPHPFLRKGEFAKLVQSVGSDLENFSCPECGSIDRERHLWLYMLSMGMQDMSKLRVLHIAPERYIERMFSLVLPVDRYVRGDLFPQNPVHLKIDIEQIQFAEGEFDLILCNHVLEHVTNLDAAISELYRCLAKGGFLIAQSPFSPLLKTTMELTIRPSEGFAKLFFGQEDHVRLFGADYESLFEKKGFINLSARHEKKLPQIDPYDAGVNGLEPFFLFSK